MNILAYKVSTERGQAQIEARNASRMLRHVPRLRLRHGARQCCPHQRAMWSVRTRLKAAPDKTYPFPHPYQAQPTGSSPRARGLRHASAVVGDGELDRVAEAQVRRDGELAAEVVSSLRKVIGGLRPPVLDDLGLVAALRHLVTEVHGRCGLPIALRVSGDEARLSSPSEMAVYLSLIHISEPTRQAEISYAVFCLK